MAGSGGAAQAVDEPQTTASVMSLRIVIVVPDRPAPLSDRGLAGTNIERDGLVSLVRTPVTPPSQCDVAVA
jgi:hypothetical protein